MKTLVLGGMKSGKSRLASQIAVHTKLPVTVIATATALDAEIEARIQKHRDIRSDEWQTVEEPIAIGGVLEAMQDRERCVVLDCLTLWMTNLLMLDDATVFAAERASLIGAIKSFSGSLIVVSNETSMGIVPMGELSRRYCDEVGVVHQELAAVSDNVILTIAGLPHVLKGEVLKGEVLTG